MQRTSAGAGWRRLSQSATEAGPSAQAPQSGSDRSDVQPLAAVSQQRKAGRLPRPRVLPDFVRPVRSVRPNAPPFTHSSRPWRRLELSRSHRQSLTETNCCPKGRLSAAISSEEGRNVDQGTALRHARRIVETFSLHECVKMSAFPPRLLLPLLPLLPALAADAAAAGGAAASAVMHCRLQDSSYE